MKISYNWLKWYIDPLPNAEELAEKIIFGAFEVEEKITVGDDTVFDIKVLPDRAHDCLSHRGMAREIAGLLGAQFIDPTEKFVLPPSLPTQLTVSVETPLCRRYMARIVRNVKVGPSPEWVVKHLASIGQRSVNNIVDATNLVMFDCGQPTHAYDLKKLSREHISITALKDEASIVTLSHEEKVLHPGELVISDDTTILAIAGVKGGAPAEVDTQTTDIVIEVANFDPVAIRKTARRLNLLTDSAKRFENEITPELASYAMRELSATLLEMCPEAQFEDICEGTHYHTPQQHHISFTCEYMRNRLGAPITQDEISSILHNYQYEYACEGETFTVSIPYERLDLIGPHDMIEEIGRAYGYNNIEAALLPIHHQPQANERSVKISLIRSDLVAQGYHEVMNYSFTKKGDYEVARGPVGRSYLRTQLSDSLKASFEINRLNKDYLEVDEMKIFEVGTVFTKEGEEVRVAWADKKGISEMNLDEYLHHREITVNPEQSDSIIQHNDTQDMFKMWSEFPSITRDIAVWVPEGETSTIVAQCIRDIQGDLCVKGPRLFDTFTKDGRTSYAFRLVFQSPDRTLTEDEIGVIIAQITETLQERGWEIR